MLLLLFSGFRKELLSKDVREFSLLVNPCSILTVFFHWNTAMDPKMYLQWAWELVPITDDPADFFCKKTLLVNSHLPSTIPPKKGKIAQFLCVWDTEIYFKDDYNLMFTMIINYSRPSGMQRAKLQKTGLWGAYGSCDSFGQLMF